MSARVPEAKAACQECGAGLSEAVLAQAGDFCCERCRQTFKNRRRLRGAEMYDLVMAMRFERALARKLGLFQAVCRMASNFREEDRRERKGRKSWRNPRAVLADRPYLKAVGGWMRAGR